ncbi:putative transcriptional regulator, BolA superfamily [Xenococcus sp. PCC 7305]|uniref:BolA family protein n=1 Tax=Xenococcus sp. PCC 7305 TaxID=102125 RepID=UPI0002ABC40F|nr:putative transcriptional regulator, BolA superfamily [Xenococcus sp. PCC 7305]
MISPQQVESMIQTKFPDAEVQVTGDGEHFEAIIVSGEFDGKPKVRQHQMVYAAVQEAMASEAIHALSLKTYTPKTYQLAVGS